MPYNFLSLVNDVAEKMNEVPLSQVNFSSATGFYKDAKNAVNWALDKISREPFNWPFQNVTVDLVLTPEQIRYNYPLDAKNLDFDTFRIKSSVPLNVNSRALWKVDYEDYIQRGSAMEDNPSRYRAVPTTVFRTKSLQFGVVPPPDKAYTLTYEYYRLMPKLEAWDDIPMIPEQFRYVIYEGSLQKAFDFRGDLETSAFQAELFKKAMAEMRSIYVNSYDYVRSTSRR